jgi:hypothetical protein
VKRTENILILFYLQSRFTNMRSCIGDSRAATTLYRLESPVRTNGLQHLIESCKASAITTNSNHKPSRLLWVVMPGACQHLPRQPACAGRVSIRLSEKRVITRF